MNTFGTAAGGGRRKVARAEAPQLAHLSTIAADRRVGLVDVSANGVHLIAPDAPAEGEDVISKPRAFSCLDGWLGYGAGNAVCLSRRRCVPSKSIG